MTIEQQAVPVAQEDREAAANMWLQLHPHRGGEAEVVRSGADDGPIVQAIARHRLARLTPIEGVAASGLPDPACHRTGWSAKLIDGLWCIGMTGNLDTVHDAVLRVNRHGSWAEAEAIARWVAEAYSAATTTPSPAIPEGTSGEGVGVTALQERIADLESELEEALYEPWPKWAEDMKKQIRAVSGYDGYDDATDGVNLPDELSELINELTEQADKNVAEARASRKLDELESSVEHYRNGMNEWIAKAQALTPERLADAGKPIDHRHLLWLYIAHVGEEEGFTFMPKSYDELFSDAERAELELLDGMTEYVAVPDATQTREAEGEAFEALERFITDHEGNDDTSEGMEVDRRARVALLNLRAALSAGAAKGEAR